MLVSKLVAIGFKFTNVSMLTLVRIHPIQAYYNRVQVYTSFTANFGDIVIDIRCERTLELLPHLYIDIRRLIFRTDVCRPILKKELEVRNIIPVEGYIMNCEQR